MEQIDIPEEHDQACRALRGPVLFTMWGRPRMAAWVFISTVILLALRLPFFAVQVIPFYIAFDPGVALIPVMGVVFGPAGVWGSVIATLLGDALMSTWSLLTAFRAIAAFLSALSAQHLWSYSGVMRLDRHAYTAEHQSVVRFFAAALPSAFVYAVWVGLGSEMAGLYPFPYVATMILLRNAILVFLLGGAFYRLFAFFVAPYGRTWEHELGLPVVARSAAVLRSALFWTSSAGGYVVGCVAAQLFYRMAPLEPYVIGITTGLGVQIPTALFAIGQVAILLIVPGRTAGRRDKTGH